MVDQNAGSQNILGVVASSIVAGVSAVFQAVGRAVSAAMDDGTIAAAGRQGADEIGVALKAFPDAIQTQEIGTLWNPTQGEVAEARRPDAAEGRETLPSPSEIAREGKAGGSLYGQSAQAESQRLPTPREIADASEAYTPQASQGHEHSHGMG